jgi:hypothetical protein
MKQKSIILSVLAWLVLITITISGILIINSIKLPKQETKENPLKLKPIEDEPKHPEFQVLDTCLSKEDVYALTVISVEYDKYNSDGYYYAVTTQDGMLYYSKHKPNIGDTVMWVDDYHNIINCEK